MPSALFTLADPVLSQQWRITYGPQQQGGGFVTEATTATGPTGDPITVVSTSAAITLYTERVDADGTISLSPLMNAALDGSTYEVDDVTGAVTVVQGPPDPGPGPGPTPTPGGGAGILIAIGAGVLGLVALAGGRNRRNRGKI